MSEPKIIKAEIRPWTGGGWETRFIARHFDGAGNLVVPAQAHALLLTGIACVVEPYGPRGEYSPPRTYPERVRFKGGLELGVGVRHTVQVVGRVVPPDTDILIPAEFLPPGSTTGRWGFMFQGFKPAYPADHFGPSPQEREGDAVARVADFPILGAGVGRSDSSRLFFSFPKPSQQGQHQVVVPVNAGGEVACKVMSDVGGVRDVWVFAFDDAGNGVLAFPEFEQLLVRDLELNRHDNSSGMERLCRPSAGDSQPGAFEDTTGAAEVTP